MLVKIIKNYIFAMTITFDDKKLQKIANDQKKCLQVLGQVRGKKLLQRLAALRGSKTLEDVRYLPGRFHELIGD